MAELRPRPLSFAETAPFIAEASATLEASPAEIWAVLADHRGWPRWFGAVKACEPTSEPAAGVGSTRRVSLPGGLSIDEEFIAWDEPSCWAFTGTAGPGLVTALVERVDLVPVDDGGTAVTYRMAAQPRSGLAWLLAVSRPAVVKNLAKALDGLDTEVQTRRGGRSA